MENKALKIENEIKRRLDNATLTDYLNYTIEPAILKDRVWLYVNLKHAVLSQINRIAEEFDDSMINVNANDNGTIELAIYASVNKPV